MNRKEELINYLKENASDKLDIVLQLVDDVVFLEGQLDNLRKYPFLKVNPKDVSMQKATPASKQYKELSQTYLNIIKVLISATCNNAADEDSPLRAYMRKLNNV